MTDDDKALCTAIKAWGYSDIVHGRKTRGEALREAADLIEVQSAEIERLREALKAIKADCEADYPPSHGAIKYAARAALGETE